MPKKKDWIGYKFNTFEVIEEDKNGTMNAKKK